MIDDKTRARLRAESTTTPDGEQVVALSIRGGIVEQEPLAADGGPDDDD